MLEVSERRENFRRGEDGLMYEFIQELKIKLGNIEDKIESLYKAIHGNGDPGLKTKNAILEAKVVFLMKAYWALAGMVATIIAGVAIYILKGFY